MAKKYGGTVYDVEGKSWDWGQALCRETYGVDWMQDPEFNYNEETITPEMPAPERLYQNAKLWEFGNHPSWVIL